MTDLTAPNGTPEDASTWVDGNDMAGALRELFTVDVTAARGRCSGCGQMGMVAEARVYTRAPGVVARCPSCDTVLLRVVRAPGRAWLDLSGYTSLEIAMPEGQGATATA